MAKLTKTELREAILADETLNQDVKGQLLDLLKTPTFGLVWEDKTEDVVENLRENLPVLKEDKSKAVISDNPEAPNHVLIEGDNLDALIALTYTHKGKFDVIYIDPPYNTGNKDFEYNDQFVDEDDSFRHSKWLSFMDKRLRIAKQLLSLSGVIFISIDDREQAQLKMLCDDIFASSNFIAQVIWERAYSPVNLKKHFSESHDYILVYANNIADAVCNGLLRTGDANNRYSNLDNDPRGDWKPGDMSVGPAVAANIYPITTPSGRIVLPPSGYSWRLSIEKYNEYVKENRIWFGSTGNNVPAIKRFLKDVKQGITPMTIWKYTEVGHSQDATKELKDIFGGESKFIYPKSVRLIQRIIHLYSREDSMVLDFFAGSGTTLHATMKLNAEDGGHRLCFLVTNNESNICEEVTYERNKRVIQGYTTPKGEKVAGLKNNSLRYYKVEHTPRKHTHANKMLLAQAMTEMLQIKWNAYNEQEKFGSLKAKPRYMRFFKGDEDVLIIYVTEIIPYVIKEIKQMQLDKKLHVYVAADGNYAFQEEFAEVLDKIELAAIPSAYYNAIRSILPTPNKETATPEDSTPEDEELLAHADINDY